MEQPITQASLDVADLQTNFFQFGQALKNLVFFHELCRKFP